MSSPPNRTPPEPPLPDPAAFDIARAGVLGDLPHGFFGRGGGCSGGEVAGLQCGYGGEEDAQTVRRNREAAAAAILPGAPLVTPWQVHSPRAIIVTRPWDDDARPEGDALVTALPGLVLAVVTADCAPVLLADREAGVIASVHAGWRGALGGVIENAIGAMESLGARRQSICAAIGPCIARASYEVGDDFRDNFAAEDEPFFEPARKGHWHFDLPAYVAHRCRGAGVASVEDLGLDTYRLESRYYSYRRATHRAAHAYGRQISCIALGPGLAGAQP